ncbi:hypothetical protein P153DRAFT_324579 [Dothidotthia symphoricarpi CBS 119687]|uniref:Uncharacterized protein n=1 Tax=Dothidotthia symphoricarpi CBS 119687 TaxID=1392245 RepID=A0A6A6A019_9PLEO|nr:uncharacterized protein P153DRAFT_324579 [Dothidotthia symphoricarpi CBS 119687]KAF2125352.1 hypothetical protein P153DRAFT_324579 [Dothidotthia symphoricarpi CBS 119687]
MAAITRQPFAELGSPRLHALQSAKNRQNAFSMSPTFAASPLKSAPTPSTGKRQRAPEIFEDDADSENTDPTTVSSPSKKTKTSDASVFTKPSRYSLTTSPATPVPSIRKALSSPNTTQSTPISHTRGSPKHNRVGALSKRRASSSPFRRVDPPSFSQRPALPFSIDAALSGTLKTYTPKAAPPTPAPAPAPAPTPAPVQNVSTLDDSMPNSWFFAIHEDTPEQEAANLMEHSASVLDISTDDDMEAKKLTEHLERGKENIPPPDFTATLPDHDATEHSTPRPRLRKIAQDAMDEDRRPLGDLPPADFYAEGCDKDTYVTVDTGIEKPSSLSKECDFTHDEAADEENVAPVVERKEITPVGKSGGDVLAPASVQKDGVSVAP